MNDEQIVTWLTIDKPAAAPEWKRWMATMGVTDDREVLIPLQAVDPAALLAALWEGALLFDFEGASYVNLDTARAHSPPVLARQLDDLKRHILALYDRPT